MKNYLYKFGIFSSMPCMRFYFALTMSVIYGLSTQWKGTRKNKKVRKQQKFSNPPYWGVQTTVKT